MKLKAMELNSEFEARFWEYVNADPLEHYFFIYDRELNPNDTRFFLAVEGERIEGVMLVYKDSLFQVRGSREAADALLDCLEIREAEASVPLDCRDLVMERYRAPREYEIVLMRLLKGNEKLIKTCEIEKLGEEHADEVAELIRGANPVWWGDTKTEDIRKSLGISLWRGVLAGGKLVSVGCTRILNFGCNIGIIATHEDFRNKGYATAVVSALVEEIFREHDMALIHVLSDNDPAVHVYEMVGFRPYRSYFQIKNGQRITAK